MIGLQYIMFVREDTAVGVSEKLGVSSQSVSHWLTNRRPIPASYAEQLAAHYNVPVELLTKELKSKDRLYLEGLLSSEELDNDFIALQTQYNNLKFNYKKLIEEQKAMEDELKDEMKRRMKLAIENI